MAHRASSVDRRGFLKGAAAGAAALVARSAPVAGAPQPPAAPVVAAPAAPADTQLRADTEPPPRGASVRLVEKPASDFMVDVIKSLGIEYAAANPGSSFEGLHESIINYGGETKAGALNRFHPGGAGGVAQRQAQNNRTPDV